MRSQPSPAFTIHSKWSIKAVKLILKDVRVQEVLAFCSGHLITKTTASLYITFDKHNFEQLKKLQIFIILQEVTTISVDKPKHKHSYLCKIIDIYVYIYITYRPTNYLHYQMHGLQSIFIKFYMHFVFEFKISRRHFSPSLKEIDTI